MALKSNFEDASFISSPFVDEVANPGVSEARAAAQRKAGEPFLSDKQRKTIAATNAQVERELNPPKAKGFFEKLIDRKKTTDELSKR